MLYVNPTGGQIITAPFLMVTRLDSTLSDVLSEVDERAWTDSDEISICQARYVCSLSVADGAQTLRKSNLDKSSRWYRGD